MKLIELIDCLTLFEYIRIQESINLEFRHWTVMIWVWNSRIGTSSVPINGTKGYAAEIGHWH